MARFFRETDNPQKAIYFYDKCLAAAVETRRAEHEADACRSLAEVHESVKNWPSAVACRERETRVAEGLLKKSAKDADAPSASASAARPRRGFGSSTRTTPPRRGADPKATRAARSPSSSGA